MRITPVLIVLAIAAGGASGYAYWLKNQTASVPPGLARVNGRIEVESVDVATKNGGRLVEVLVEEGDEVEKGSILARLDTTEALAQLAASKAAVHRAHQLIRRAQINVVLRAAELKLTEVELKRVINLQRNNTASVAELDRRTAQRDVANALLDGAKVDVEDAKAATEAAEAQVAQLEAVIADMTLKAPVSGRVEYRLAQQGKVVAAGGRVLTLLNLSDMHMAIFLPTSQIGQVVLGSEARIVFDGMPDYVIPATVAFVAAEAQFTPKYVETMNEREKLMYRVKLHIDPQFLQIYPGHVKAGLTGNAYVKLQASAIWPDGLVPRLPDAP